MHLVDLHVGPTDKPPGPGFELRTSGTDGHAGLAHCSAVVCPTVPQGQAGRTETATILDKLMDVMLVSIVIFNLSFN